MGFSVGILRGGERSKLTAANLARCERLDAAPLWLEGVWEGELEESMLERFVRLWKFGCDAPRSPQPSWGR